MPESLVKLQTAVEQPCVGEETLEEAIAWLEQLCRQTSRVCRDPVYRSLHRTVLRNLTGEEWIKTAILIQRHKLPCRLLHGCYGFSLEVYGHSDWPEIQPGAVLVVEDGQFPFESAKRGFSGQGATLQQLSQLTHNTHNKELLEWYKFEPQADVASYAY